MAYQIFEVPKDPDSRTNYGRNWGTYPDGTPGWLSDTDYIITSNWFITTYEEPPILEIYSQGINAGGQSTYFWVDAGTDGANYKMTNRITTFEGLTEDYTAILYVKSK